MINSATPKEEKTEILNRLKKMSDKKLGSHEKEIKLTYVTVLLSPRFYYHSCLLSQPERLSKDKRFLSLLQRLDEAKKLGWSTPYLSLIEIADHIGIFSTNRDR